MRENIEHISQLPAGEMLKFLTDKLAGSLPCEEYKIFRCDGEASVSFRIISGTDDEHEAMRKLRDLAGGKFHVQGEEVYMYISKTLGEERLTITLRHASWIFLSGEGEFRLTDPTLYRKYIYYGGHDLITEATSRKVWPVTMKDLFDGDGKYHLKDLVCESIMRYFGKENRLWNDLADDLLAGSAYSAIPAKEIWESHSRQELIERHYGASLKRNNKEPIGHGIFLVQARRVVLENEIQELYGFSPGRVYIGRKKKDLAWPLARFIYENMKEIKSLKLPHGYKLTITPDFIYDAISDSIDLRRKISISYKSARRILEWHDEVNNIRMTRDYATVKIPKTSRYRKLKMPDDCVRLTTRRQFIEEGEFQRNCVASYIDFVNKDNCSIWSMRKDDGTRNTIEIRIRKSKENPNGYFYIQQMRSFANSDVSDEDYEIIRECITRQRPCAK